MNTETIIKETSDESIHALQQEEVLEQWVIDLLEGREVDFWWVY